MFSINGRCARTGEFGIAVSSSSPAVAARCAHARAGVGVVGAQNITDPQVDWAEADPVAALAALWARWQPGQEAYLQRALDPTVAPSFGVPGDP
jgi:uncharacterized Ntn-hydrolase superfamily protein